MPGRMTGEDEAEERQKQSKVNMETEGCERWEKIIGRLSLKLGFNEPMTAKRICSNLSGPEEIIN